MAFDFASVSTPFRMQPGLRRLAPGNVQLTPSTPGDRAGDRALREKLAVLGSNAAQALLAAPGFDSAPALQALGDHANQEHPQAWSSTGPGSAQALLLGWSLHDGELRQHHDAAPEVGLCLEALPPEWRYAGLLCLAFAEDFAVIDGATATIPWLAVCLPSGWAPEEKVGRHFAQVHAPVADNQLLVTASDHLSRLVTGEDRWERFVWTLSRHPRLHAHPRRVDPTPWPADATVDELVARAYFRAERQTFIPLRTPRQAVFTIHVSVTPMREALADAAHARQVHDALATMSPAVLEYRGLAPARDRLLQWLAARAGA